MEKKIVERTSVWTVQSRKESEANKDNQLDTPQVHLYHIHWFPYMNHSVDFPQLHFMCTQDE